MYFFSVIQIIVFLIGIYLIAKNHSKRKLIALAMAACTGYLFFLMYGFPLIGAAVSMEPVKHHLREEIRELINLGIMLIGFACLANQFAKSGVCKLIASKILNKFSGKIAESLILAMVWLLSGFCDNIASALIGTGLMTVIHGKFKLRLVLLVTIMANAGGAYTVVGDTTTTLLWIKGITQLELLPGFIPSFTCMLATLFFGVWIKRGGHKHVEFSGERMDVAWWRFFLIIICIGGAFLCNFKFGFPCFGIMPLILVTIRESEWAPVKEGFSASCFLLPLIVAAGFINLGLVIPHDTLRSYGMIVSTAFISALIDNIPVTKIMFEADVGHWALLAFCVGVGGSMTYFGSTTSVAVIEGYHKEVQEELQNNKHKNLFVYWTVHGWFMWPVIGLSILASVLV